MITIALRAITFIIAYKTSTLFITLLELKYVQQSDQCTNAVEEVCEPHSLTQESLTLELDTEISYNHQKENQML